MIAMVLGGAACVYDDARALERMVADAGVEIGAVIAANQIGIHWPRITHWVSLHAENLAKWQAERRAMFPDENYIVVAIRRPSGLRVMPRIDRTLPDWGGSSGLFGVRTALEIAGSDRVVCCGIPMTRTPHFNKDKPWAHVDSFWLAWKRQHRHFAGRVRSMSGNTAMLLGKPDAKFLRGETRNAG